LEAVFNCRTKREDKKPDYSFWKTWIFGFLLVIIVL